MNMHLMTPLGATGYGYVGLNILQTLSENHNIGFNEGVGSDFDVLLVLS